MLTYHNAVSDKLIIFLDYDSSIYQIYSKDNQLKYRLNHHDISSFPEELSAAIFSSTYLQLVNSKFALCPLVEEKIDPFFQLNHGTGIDFLTAQNGTFKIGYEKHQSFDLLTQKLVNTNVATDIELLFEYTSKKTHKHALYFYEHQGILSIIAWRDNVFVLSNRYSVGNTDELFYFVMLVIEQLEIPIQKIYVECIASLDNYEEYKSLFKNYLLSFQHTTILDFKSNEDNSKILSHFFAQCVL
tara:strand:- start:586 stop:1314 length:729 start_codon:yes stop_codon:yes gene_type:complete